MYLKIDKQLQYPWQRILQRAGYHEHSGAYVKRISGDYYPRFHIYLEKESDEHLELSLHLDQRRTVYKGVKAHAGEDNSPTVINEGNRLISLFKDNYLNT